MLNAILRFRDIISTYRKSLLLGTTLTIVDVAVSLAEPWPLRTVVDGVLRPDGGRVDDAQLRIALAVLAMVVLVAIGSVVSYWSMRLLSAAGLNIGSDLRERVMAHLQGLSLRFHGDHRVGDLSARVTSDVDNSQEMLVQVLATLFPNVLLVVGMFVVMMFLDPVFTLLALASTVPLVIATHRSRSRLREAARRTRKANGELASAATESLAAVHLVQAFTLEHDRMQRFAGLSRTSRQAGLEAVRYQARFGPMVDIAGMLSAALVLWFGANRVLDGSLSLGVLLVFLSYLGSLFKPIKALSKLSTVVSKGAAATERIIVTLDTVPEIVDRPRAVRLPIMGGIRFDDVSFSYGRESVLNNLSFDIEPGQTVALVGPTGAGKSTIASLIPRLVDVDSGAVTIDDIDVRDFKLASLRGQLAMVLQESVLFNGTLRDNIVCGRQGAGAADVARAARLALVDEFACRLPAGLDTHIGERGANLSGGQRQRVAIARAILRDSRIIILDEPTSALDAASEQLLMEALSNLPAGRTTLVIAHRLSTVRQADKILVIEAGALIESGSHDELIRRGGLYSRLSSFQSARKAEAATYPAFPPPIAS